MQPQLFVCESFEELTEALEKFSETMAFKTGGKEGLEKAIRSENHATAELNSGLQITGTFTETIENDAGELIYMRTSSPTALAIHNKQLANHSTSVHSDGFGTPIGLLTENIALENCTDEQLQSLGITIGNVAEFTFASGIHVKGTVTDIVKTIIKSLLFPLSIVQLLITTAFYLMLHGAHLIWLLVQQSLRYSQVPQMLRFFPMDEEIQEIPAPLVLNELERMYQTVRDIRNEGILHDAHIEQLVAIQEVLNKLYPKEWLLRLEILELLLEHNKGHETSAALLQQLSTFTTDEAVTRLINNGLTLLPVKDVKNDATIN